jgi:hypothetical protein
MTDLAFLSIITTEDFKYSSCHYAMSSLPESPLSYINIVLSGYLCDKFLSILLLSTNQYHMFDVFCKLSIHLGYVFKIYFANLFLLVCISLPFYYSFSVYSFCSLFFISCLLVGYVCIFLEFHLNVFDYAILCSFLSGCSRYFCICNDISMYKYAT